jgi:Family of unknown function (DUF6228)
MNMLRISTPGGVEVIFSNRAIDAGGSVDSFKVQLRAQNLDASTYVENPGYGQPPSKLLSELAESWAGWKGIKAWDAMEGELRIEATADALGHVTLKFMLPGNSGRSDWSVAANVVCEAGQLEAISKEANQFFSGSDA